MSRKRKNLPVVPELEITGIAAEGNAIARWGDLVVFVPYGAPGDIADIKIEKKRSSYANGRIERLVKPSAQRCEPKCSHFGTCGGCRWQHLPYDLQLRAKQQQVEDALRRIAKVELPEITPIFGSENIWEYRNKMEYTFSNRRWLTWEQVNAGEVPENRCGAGFHISGAFDKVLDIDRCWLQDDLGNRIRNSVKNYALEKGYTFFDLKAQNGLLRTMMIRIATTGQVMVLMAFGEDNTGQISDVLDFIKDNFPEVTSLMYAINTKANDSMDGVEVLLYAGMPYIEEKMESLVFRVGPKSFYQTNSAQALNLYRTARDFAGLTGNELVYDLYTGTGTIANFVARDARKVIGIEYVPEAIADAKVNSAVNGIGNTEFFAGDMKDVLNDGFIAEHGIPDVMIVDPPRAGMHQDVVDTILRARPARIVYVSCNPSTQARDIALLDGQYRVERVRPVDMFPHTHHVENVVLLVRRD